MIIVYISALLTILYNWLLFGVPIVLYFTFDTNREIMRLSVYWLRPFIKATVKMADFKPTVTVFIFNKRVYSKAIERKQAHKYDWRSLPAALKLKETKIKTRYGMSNPFSTGIFCGAVETLRAMLGLDNFEHHADFLSENEFVFIEAQSKLNIGKTLFNLLKLKPVNLGMKRRKVDGYYKLT